MPPKTVPTARQRRLGAELRKLREAAGVSTADAAALLGVNRTRIPNIESGRFGVSPDRVRTLACNYECPDTDLIEALADMAQPRGRKWWDHYLGKLPAAFLDVAEQEHHSPRMRVFLMVHMPGLLQTAAYTRAIFERSMVSLPEREIELRVAHRMERQGLLFDSESPPHYTALVHEAALRMKFGGSKTTKAQLQFLAEASEHANITLRVLSFAAEGFPGPGQPILYAHGAVPQLDTVQLDTFHGSIFLDTELRLRNYRNLLDRTEDAALSEEQSRDLIREIIHEL
jgi:transcriptional regulator with XRE-family HTH domain